MNRPTRPIRAARVVPTADRPTSTHRGHESGRQYRHPLRQNLCIQTALRLNGLAPHPLYPVAKLLDKGRQFIVRPPAITDPVSAS